MWADSSECLQCLLDASLDGVAILDPSGRILDWNRCAAEMLGWTRDELVGQSFIPRILPEAEAVRLKEILATDHHTVQDDDLKARLRIELTDKCGVRRPMLLAVNPVRTSSEFFFAIFLRDLTAQQRTQQQLVQRASEARLLHQATMVSATAESFSDAISECLALMCEITDWPIGHAWLPDDSRQFLVCSRIWQVPDGGEFQELREASLNLQLRPGEGLPGRIWKVGQPEWVADISSLSDSEWARRTSECGVRGTFGFPVFADGEIAAVLEFFSPQKMEPDPHLLLLLGTLGGQIGRVIEQRRWDEERGRLAAIVESSCDAIISKSLDGVIRTWNAGAELVYGYTAEEAIGQPISITMPKDITAEEAEIASVAQHGDRLQQFETVRQRKDGTRVNVSISVSPIRGARNRIIGTATIERDITARKKQETDLKLAFARVENANRAKNEFLANISHELRTPMNAIIGMVELALGDQSLSPVLRDYLDTARDSSHILLALMNDLLDFSRMEAGRFELEPDPFRLRRAVSEAMRVLSLRAHEKGLELTFQVDPDVPNHLLGDGRRLRQVVMNLVGNAIKFTDEGEVRVQISLRERQGDDIQLLMSVSDTGRGIPPEERERIFEPFTQVDASTTREQPGTGLGLAICHELVTKMGGEIWLESEEGVGTTFYCTPRFQVLNDPQIPAHEDRLVQVRGTRVLVVDDNATNRRILHEMLSHWGVKATAASSAAEAVAAVEAVHGGPDAFTLVLVDALMPEMDGFSLIETLQARGLAKGANILMLSSADRQTFDLRCRELKISAYLEKPVSQSTLLDAMITALAGMNHSVRASDSIATTPTPLSILVAEDTPANQKVVRAILERRGHSVAIAANGKEALQMLRMSHFDVVLMDVQMPVLDGLQATAEIRRMDDPAKSGIPIVAMTAHAMKRDRQRCLDAGMDAYIAKPIDAEALVRLIEQTQGDIRREQARMQDFKQPSDRKHADNLDASVPVMNLSAARSRIGSDDLLKDMAQFFLEDAPELISNLEQAISQHDGESAARSAHSLKGLASNFDAERVMTPARQIEVAAREGDFSLARMQFPFLSREVTTLVESLLGAWPELKR